MYEWSWGIFAKKTKFHGAGGPGTMVSPTMGIIWLIRGKKQGKNGHKQHKRAKNGFNQELLNPCHPWGSGAVSPLSALQTKMYFFIFDYGM